MKKFFDLLIIGCLFLGGAQTAKAQWAVTEVNPAIIVPTASTSVTNATTSIQQVWQVAKDAALIPIVKSLADNVLDKLVKDTVNWASGGFDGAPGFINNWDDFLQGTQYAVLNSAFNQANQAVNFTSGGVNPDCLPEISAQTSIASGLWQNLGSGGQAVYGSEANYVNNFLELNISPNCTSSLGQIGSEDIQNIAEQNYYNYISGEFQSGRNIAETIALYGAQQLNIDPLTYVINQQGETLTELLGSSQAKEQFKSDFSAGGWLGYIALVDPNNTDIGVSSITRSALGNKATNQVNSVIQNLQTPEKFLDKTECREYALNENTGQQECIREVTITPGQQVGARVNSALNKEQEQAQLADELVGLLVNSIGDLTSGLIDGGLSTIGGAVSGSFFDAANNSFSGGENENFQSQYDILGIENDGFVDSSTPIITVDPGNPNSTGEAGFIGGPEDDLGFGNSPQIIINFQERLEANITLANQEQDYFNRIIDLRSENEDTAINIDQCLPGPDYNWQQRFDDIFPSFGNDEESQINGLASYRTKEMYRDSKVTIPGAAELRGSFNSIVSANQQEASENRQRIDALGRVTSTLSLIVEEIYTDFNIQKAAISDNLVLYLYDWNELSSAQQQEVFTIAVNNGFFLLETGETIASVLDNDNEAAARAVIAMAWDLWRTETPAQQKNDLRYALYTIENDLSTEQSVSSARLKLDLLESDSARSRDLLFDCLVLKLYSLGVSEAVLENFVSNNDYQGMIEHPALDFVDLTPLNGSDINFIDTSNARTNDEIKAFLQEEYDNLTDASELTTSLFKTSALVNPLAISRSILGFDNQIEMDEYFASEYPDDDLDYPYIKNAKTIKDIYLYDRFRWDNSTRGTLFCRHPENLSFSPLFIFSDISAGSVCLVDWYIASTLDYEVAFAGI